MLSDALPTVPGSADALPTVSLIVDAILERYGIRHNTSDVVCEGTLGMLR